MELQHAWPTLQRAGAALYAISYDGVADLAAFAERYGITFPLLSDTGSQTIRRLGLLNEHLVEQHTFYGVATRDEQHGVAYPGTFVLDEQGVVRAKHFEQSYRVRPTASVILEWASAPAESVTAAPAVATGGDGEARLEAWTDSPTYRPYQQVRLHARLTLPPGQHAYAPPVPEGYVAFEVDVAPMEGLDVGQAVLPPSRPFTVEGLDESFQVYEGSVEAVVPVMLTKNLGPTRLRARVRYQACTETTCFPPATAEVEVGLSGQDLIRD